MVMRNCFIHPWRTASRSLYIILVMGLAACSSAGPDKAELADFQRERAQEARVQELNEQLALQGQTEDTAVPEGRAMDSYRLGPGDLLDIVVLGVAELNRKVRIDGNGMIGLPLIGEVSVDGLTVEQAGKLVADRYEETYLQNPQVSVLIDEYRSQQITVLGAVRNPEVYAVQRQMTLLGTLAMAGGLTERAGNTVYVKDWVKDPETNERVRRNMVVSLDEMVSSQGRGDVILGNEAVVSVPSAGVVYVEGAVAKPGAYDLQGNTTVLKAIAMAGGLMFEADSGGLKLLRLQQNGEEEGQFKPQQFDIDTLRENPGNDIVLQDGDIVVVEASAFKSAVQTLIDTTRGFFGFGYSLNR